MSELKTFEQLTEDSFEKKGIVSLADRPNQASTFGVGGLTAAELKARFDALPQLIRGKLNEIYTALSGEYATQYIAMPTGTQENLLPSSWGKYKNVSDFILAFASGEISEDLVVKTNEGNLSLSAIINNLFKATNSNEEDISALNRQIDFIYDEITLKQEKLIAGEGIVIQGNVISAPKQSDTAGTSVLINNAFVQEVSFTSDPQEQIDGKADKTQLNGKADKNSVESVTRIDVTELRDNPYNRDISLSELISIDIERAISNKPIGASRANIEFYNVPDEDLFGNYLYWNDVVFQSNCNYKLADFTEIQTPKYINLTNIENCDFEGLLIKSNDDMGVSLNTCKNLQFLNCSFYAFSSNPFAIENSTDIYFENCVFDKSTYPVDCVVITDTGSNFRWIMFENCVFKKVVGNYAINVSAVTNTKNLVSVSNCHFDDLTKVRKDDVIIGSGKVSITATEDEIPTKLSELENDTGFTTTTTSPEVTRISIYNLLTDGRNTSLAAKITEAIENAYKARPQGAARANIEFYNIPAAEDENWDYEYWNDVTFESNCNYRFSVFNDRLSSKYINLVGLENCDFEGFNIGSTRDLGFTFKNCKNIQVLNSSITSLCSRPLSFENCNELYFENCVFERSSYPSDYEIIFTDNGSGFRWIMFDNCVFSKHEGMTPFDASGVTNARSLISFANCHFSDLTNITESDFEGLGSGKISLSVDQTEVGKSAYGYAQDGGYTGTESEFTQDFAKVLSLTSAEEESV
jgi:hypothetical protein